MTTNADVLDSLIPITQFNKGFASKIFDRLKTERQLVVLKNNAPTAVILSPDEYRRLSEADENLYLLQLAQTRLTENWKDRAITHAKFWEDAGITEKDMADALVPEIE